MAKGLVYGLLYNIVVAIGLFLVAETRAIHGPVMKSSLMLLVGGIVSVPIVAAIVVTEHASVSELLFQNIRTVVHIGIGAVLVLVVGEALYISGLAASNLTTMALAALTYPGIVLILEVATKRLDPRSLGFREVLGFALLSVGFILLTVRR